MRSANYRNLVYGSALVVLVFLALLVTNPFFAVLEDETSIIDAANKPIIETVQLFVTGQGQHEHPPLSDLLLHFWLPVAGVNPSLTRLPSIVFYALALLVLATVAHKLSGPVAFYTTVITGALWPFGFHLGRIAGWYSFSFLLIALLTLAYLRFLEAPNWKRWLLVVGISFALVTSNYFGWLVIGLVGLDLLFSPHRRDAWKYLVLGLAVLIPAYGPLWITFVDELHDSLEIGTGMVSRGLMAIFCLYALFVSESVAPWFLRMSLIAGLGVACALVCTLLLTRGLERRLYVGFWVLFIVMAALGIIATKRLLFISGWLLVAIGCAVANRKQPRVRALLAGSLSVVAVVGWMGIITRKYYAAPHFIEPWSILADDAALYIKNGGTVVSNSPSFLFYLNSSMHKSGLSSVDRPGWATGPYVVSLLHSDMPSDRLEGELMFVRGVNTAATEITGRAEARMMSHCRLKSSTNLVPDTGFALKRRLFPTNPAEPYRITVKQFDCGASK